MKNALVTGSTRGIGLQIGLDLLKSGYSVYFNGRKEPTPELQTGVGSFLLNFIQADCSSIGSIDTIANQIPPTGLDALILNVGMTDRTTMAHMSLGNWNTVLRTNLTIPMFLIQRLYPSLNYNSKIIFITSISGIVPDSVSIPYGVSKAAANMLVKYLAKELAHKKINVNAIAPGYTMTGWHQNKPQDQLARIANKTLLNRFGTPKEISSVVQMLIKNDYITGQILQVDGGFKLD